MAFESQRCLLVETTKADGLKTEKHSGGNRLSKTVLPLFYWSDSLYRRVERSTVLVRWQIVQM